MRTDSTQPSPLDQQAFEHFMIWAGDAEKIARETAARLTRERLPHEADWWLAIAERSADLWRLNKDQFTADGQLKPAEFTDAIVAKQKEVAATYKDLDPNSPAHAKAYEQAGFDFDRFLKTQPKPWTK